MLEDAHLENEKRLRVVGGVAIAIAKLTCSFFIYREETKISSQANRGHEKTYCFLYEHYTLRCS
jgi:hypothetical protein